MSAIMNISLYIPHIFANYSKDDVAEVFENQNIGKVKNIDFISKLGQDGKPFSAAYIHFDHWFNNTAAANFQERVLNPEKEARLMYEDPWYWIVLENKARKVVSGDRKPRIDLGDAKVISCTPEKPITQTKCPDAPVKKSYASILHDFIQTKHNLASEFCEAELNELAEQCEMDAEMDEIEAIIEEDDQYLVSVDSRYIESIEAENMDLRAQIAYFHNALCVEQIKTQALAEAIGKTKKE